MSNGCHNCLFNKSRDCPWKGTYHHKDEYGKEIGICNAWKLNVNNIKTEGLNMKRMTSEIIEQLQKCVEKYGDMPFEIRDNENGCSFFDISVFADTIENGGCYEEETPVIGISF